MKATTHNKANHDYHTPISAGEIQRFFRALRRPLLTPRWRSHATLSMRLFICRTLQSHLLPHWSLLYFQRHTRLFGLNFFIISLDIRQMLKSPIDKKYKPSKQKCSPCQTVYLQKKQPLLTLNRG